MLLDMDTTNKLRKLLENGNQTYLSITEPNKYEIVKVSFAGLGSFLIDRGQDGTTAANFSTGAKVAYVLPVAAVQEVAQELGAVNYRVRGGDNIEVVETGPNEYTLSTPTVQIASVSNLIDITKVGNVFRVRLADKVKKCIEYVSGSYGGES